MPKKIASREERIRRIRKGYLEAGKKGTKNTTKLYGKTGTEEIAGWSAADVKNPDKKTAAGTAAAKRVATRKAKTASQKAYDKKQSAASTMKTVMEWKRPKPRKKVEKKYKRAKRK